MTIIDSRRRLGAWLRGRRIERKWTTFEVAHAIGVDVSHVYSCERGRHAPRFDRLHRWLEVLGVDLLDAIEREFERKRLLVRGRWPSALL